MSLLSPLYLLRHFTKCFICSLSCSAQNNKNWHPHYFHSNVTDEETDSQRVGSTWGHTSKKWLSPDLKPWLIPKHMFFPQIKGSVVFSSSCPIKLGVSVDNRLAPPETCSQQNHLQLGINIVSFIKSEETILAHLSVFLQLSSSWRELICVKIVQKCVHTVFFAIGKTLTFLLYLKDPPLHAVQDSVGNWFKIQIPTSEVTESYNLWLNLAWEPGLWSNQWKTVVGPLVFASLLDESGERDKSFPTEQK